MPPSWPKSGHLSGAARSSSRDEEIATGHATAHVRQLINQTESVDLIQSWENGRRGTAHGWIDNQYADLVQPWERSGSGAAHGRGKNYNKAGVTVVTNFCSCPLHAAATR